MTTLPTSGNLLFYTSPEGDTKVKVFLQNEMMRMSQKQMGELFGVNENNITYHLKEIYASGELDEKGTTQIFGVLQKEGNRKVNRQIGFYNLDVIIAVGYRVNSYQATKFRIRATNVLKEFMIKGFVMDDERLKNGVYFGKEYFEELLARIREIRASERRFYQKIIDIYATSVDYDAESPLTKDFFTEVQNKFLYAVSSKTAPELQYYRADHQKPYMGLTSWKGQKTSEKIISTDIKIGKNYLSEEEITNLNLLISQYLDFAEYQARNQQLMTMQEWIEKTKDFLKLNNAKVLVGKGTISKETAEQKVEAEFEKFRKIQDKNYLGEFDKFVEKVQKKKL